MSLRWFVPLIAGALAQPGVTGWAPAPGLLPAGTRSLCFNITVAEKQECRWGLRFGSQPAPAFAAMQDFAPAGSNGTGQLFTAELSNISSVLTSNVSIRCASNPEAIAVELNYRALPDAAQRGFPRVGNLWGSYNFDSKPIEYAAAHIDLWMGESWDPASIARLRELKPNVLILGSNNAVEDQGEGDSIPERYFLHNVSGQSKADRLETWPGSYRLNLASEEVARWKGQQMVEIVLRGSPFEGHPYNTTVNSIPLDGVFVDNVFLEQPSKTDIYGRPFYPDTTGDGKPDDQTTFQEHWRAGVLLQLNVFREALPNAVMSGHCVDYTQEPGVFNGVSIGFDVPRAIEGYAPTQGVIDRMQGWMSNDAVPEPRITMVESAPPLQLGYGYGFNVQALDNMPPPTREFVRTYFPNVRFGLALALMQGAYFAHELGDSYHGSDWWYDELDFALGQPTGPYKMLANCGSAEQDTVPCVAPDPAAQAQEHTGGRERVWSGLSDEPAWSLWVDPASGAAATLAWDTNDTRTSNATARVVVTAVSNSSKEQGLPCLTPPHSSIPSTYTNVDLFYDGLTLVAGRRYALHFWAKGVAAGAGPLQIAVNTRSFKTWEDRGLDALVTLRSDWAAYRVEFEAPHSGCLETCTDVRMSFWFGGQMADAHVDVGSVEMELLPAGGASGPAVYLREFECGVVLLNADGGGGYVGGGTGRERTIVFPNNSKIARIPGTQAPRVQRIIDDRHPTKFRASPASNWSQVDFEGGYDPSNPNSEEPSGPYFHSWQSGCRAASAPGAFAEWLDVVAYPGVYNISAWWANATVAPGMWSEKAQFTVLQNGTTVVQTAIVNLAGGSGDQWNLVAASVKLAPGASIRLECIDSGRLCIADAVLIESEARFNDGGDIGSSYSINAMDGAVLAKSGAKTCKR